MQPNWICSLCAIWLVSFETSSALTKLNATLGGSAHFQQFIYWRAPWEWRFGLLPDSKLIAVRRFDEPFLYPECEGRCELSSTGDLRLHNLTFADQGHYIFTVARISPYPSQTVYYWLDVYSQVPAVTLTTNTTGWLWALEDQAHLNCSTEISNASFAWSMNGQSLPEANSYKFNQDIWGINSILTISPVSSRDTGDLTCTAYNATTKETSNALKLSVAWPPDSLNIACHSFTIDSSSVGFTCTWRGGHPAANIDLVFNGEVMSGQDQVNRYVTSENDLQKPELICRGDQLGKKSECKVTYGCPQAAKHDNSAVTSATEGGEARMSVEVTSPIAFYPEFSWFRLTPDPIPIKNGDRRFSIESSDFESNLFIHGVIAEDDGMYRCRARNIAGTTNFTFNLEVAPKALSPSNGLSGGAIGGIVIGAVAGVTLIGFSVFFAVKMLK